MKNRFCFIDYEDPRDVDEAIRAMDGRHFDGETIVVARPKGRENHGRGFRPERSEWRIRIENVPPRVHWQDLKDKFRRCGEVVFGDIYKGIGYLEFRYKEDMYYALDNMHQTDWFGYTLHVLRAQPVDLSKREARSRATSHRGDSRSRSRSRTRSPRGDRDKRSRRSPSPRNGRRGHSRDRSHSPRESRSPSVSPKREIKKDSPNVSNVGRKDNSSRSRSPHDRSKSKSKSNSRSPSH